MASFEGDNIATRPTTQENNNNDTTTKRKRKIEIKKVEQLNRRHVTFSKRKLGLFNKVTELSILCHAKTALIITSPNGKLYACGYPSPDTVIQQFLAGENPLEKTKQQQQQQDERVETLRIQYEAIQEQLKEEKNNLQAVTDAQKSGSGFPSWWNFSIEDMNLECLEQFKTSLEHLKLNLVTAMEEKKFSSLPPLPIAVAPPPPPPPQQPILSNYSLLNECFGQQQVQDWKIGTSACAGASSSFMVPDFGHYY